MTNDPGIYRILNIINNKIYIGSTFNLKKRKKRHLSDLKRNVHPNNHLQAAFNKYGVDNFKLEVIELVPRLECESKLDFKKRLVDYKEQYYLDALLFASENNDKFTKLGYNICRKAISTLGVTAWNKGTKRPIEWIEKGLNTKKNNPQTKKTITEEHKQAIRNANTGRPKTEKQIKDFVERNKNNPPWNKGLKGFIISKQRKSIIQLDEEHKFVKEFASITEAKNKTGITNIHIPLKNPDKKAGGYFWIYK